MAERSIGLRLILMVAAIANLGSFVEGAEPQVGFVVKKGWLHFKVEKEEAGLPGVVVQSFDSNGQKFAEGETGDGGTGSFPLPPGNRFMVELKVGNRNADPVWLTKIDSDVVPREVLLSFGLRPCCRLSVIKDAEKSTLPEEESSWLPWICSGAVVMAGIWMSLYRLRRRGPMMIPVDTTDSKEGETHAPAN